MSESGTPIRISGVRNDTIAICLKPSSDNSAKLKPRNRAPESPMKILAGWKLKYKNPIMLPRSNKHSSATITLPIRNDITAIVPIAIAETPAASPSKPSIRLMAFVTPTIHRMVNGIATQVSTAAYVWNGILANSIRISNTNTTTQAVAI
ncbi:hypothetical protein D3C81_1492820 [compost metagenome]